MSAIRCRVASRVVARSVSARSRSASRSASLIAASNADARDCVGGAAISVVADWVVPSICVRRKSVHLLSRSARDATTSACVTNSPAAASALSSRRRSSRSRVSVRSLSATRRSSCASPESSFSNAPATSVIGTVSTTSSASGPVHNDAASRWSRPSWSAISRSIFRLRVSSSATLATLIRDASSSSTRADSGSEARRSFKRSITASLVRICVSSCSSRSARRLCSSIRDCTRATSVCGGNSREASAAPYCDPISASSFRIVSDNSVRWRTRRGRESRAPR